MDGDLQSLMGTGEGDEKVQTVQKSGKKTANLTDEQVVGNTILMFVVGYETVSTGLCSVLYCLGSHSEIQNRLRQEILDELGDEGTDVEDTDKLYSKVMGIKYLDQCIHEALRLFPPVTG